MNKWLIGIIVLASLLRLTFLNTHMPSLYGDEISIGYNAYSVLKTGKDEFGKFLPLQFESWGDQKNPVYIYTVALAEIFFGLTAVAVRLPSALSGILAVYLTYRIVKELNQPKVGLITAGLLAISPWHIHISRGGYEANMALTLGLAGVLGFLLWLRTTERKYLILSLASFVIAMYTYYTTKLFIPLLILLLWVWGYAFVSKEPKKYIRKGAQYIGIFAIFCLPLAYLALFSNGQARFAKINIFSNPEVSQRVIQMRNQSAIAPSMSAVFINKPYIWLRDFLEYFGDNLSASFWYVAGDSSLRYSIGNHGMFYLIEAPFFLVGLLYCFQRNKKIFFLVFPWILLAVLPTALVGKSYGLRSIAMLPIPLFFTAYGLVTVYQILQTTQRRIATNTAIVILTLAWIAALSNWLVRYAFFYPVYGYYWYDGMQKDAISYALQAAKQYDHIYITKYYGKTEMYYAFYGQIDPQEYQKCSQQKVMSAGSEMVQCGHYYFGDIDTKNKSFEDLKLPPNSLVIGSPEAAFGNETILAKDDGRIVFKIIK